MHIISDSVKSDLDMDAVFKCIDRTSSKISQQLLYPLFLLLLIPIFALNAINSIVAQTLNICFAKSYNAPFLKVHTSIRIADDSLESTSYYLQEVLTIKELIKESKGEDSCLFVLDEIFKGTNIIERVSGGKAILSYLNQKNHIVLVSTHDIELTELLQKENYELYHFSEQIENNKLSFDHKLKSGKLKTRNAIKILELYDYPTEITADARKTEGECYN